MSVGLSVHGVARVGRKTWIHPSQTWTDVVFYDKDDNEIASVTVHHKDKAVLDVFEDSVRELCG
jgi:hypothetical protein